MKIRDDELFGVLWRFLQLAVHRYNSGLTGEVLVVMTIVILARSGRNPTVSELTSITRIPKSNVSRYVSKQLAAGHLTEEINPQDRRRRMLCPTKAGIKEQEWISQQISQLAATIGRDDNDLYKTLLKFARGAN